MTIESTLDALTDEYFKLDGGSVNDLYTQNSFVLEYFLKDKKGNYDSHSGGTKIKIPIRFDDNAGGFFVRGTPLDSTQQQAITAVYLPWRYCAGNSTVYQIDSWENDGIEARVDMVTEEIKGGQLKLMKLLGTSVFSGLEGDTLNLTGLNAVSDTTATTNYAEYCSNDIVSADGTKVWTGLGSSTTTSLSLPALRTIRTAAAYGDGKLAEPDFIATTEANYNTIKAILDVHQVLTKEGVNTVKYGFSGIHFEGCDIFPDRYVAADNLYALSSVHCGFTVNPKGAFKRLPWQVIPNSPNDKTMKHVFAGNWTCNNRRSCYRHSDIS